MTKRICGHWKYEARWKCKTRVHKRSLILHIYDVNVRPHWRHILVHYFVYYTQRRHCCLVEIHVRANCQQQRTEHAAAVPCGTQDVQTPSADCSAPMRCTSSGHSATKDRSLFRVLPRTPGSQRDKIHKDAVVNDVECMRIKFSCSNVSCIYYIYIYIWFFACVAFKYDVKCYYASAPVGKEAF